MPRYRHNKKIYGTPSDDSVVSFDEQSQSGRRKSRGGTKDATTRVKRELRDLRPDGFHQRRYTPSFFEHRGATLLTCFSIFAVGVFATWAFFEISKLGEEALPAVQYKTNTRPATSHKMDSPSLEGPQLFPSVEQSQNDDGPLDFDEILGICWNDREGYFDFSSAQWQSLAHRRQVEYAKAYQAWYAKKRGLPLEQEVTLRSAHIQMVLIPPGKFSMGSLPEEHDEFGTGAYPDKEKLHRVLIRTPFYVGKYEITQRQWQAVMFDNPAYFRRAQKPVESVSFQRALAFCRKARVEMLSEAQWEYACRAGTTSAFNLGHSIQRNQVNYGNPATVAVGSMPNENAWGCYDFHGNVWEWCRDLCEIEDGIVQTETYIDGIVDPLSREGSFPVFRGGSCRCRAWYCRSAVRSNMGVYLKNNGQEVTRNRYDPFTTPFGDVGFRVAKKIR